MLRDLTARAVPYALVVPFAVAPVQVGLWGRASTAGFAATAALLGAIALWQHRARLRSVRGDVVWVLGGAAVASWVWTYEWPDDPLSMTLAAGVAAAGYALTRARREAWAVMLTLLAGAWPVSTVRSPPMVLFYVGSAVVTALALSGHRGHARSALMVSVATFAWITGWWGLGFYMGRQLRLGPTVTTQPGIRAALDEPSTYRLFEAHARWIAESCDGRSLLAGYPGGLMAGPRATRELEPVALDDAGLGMHPDLVDTQLFDCNRGRVVLLLESPVALVFVGDGERASVRVASTGESGAARRAWLADDGTFWIYVRGGPHGDSLLHVRDDGSVLATLPEPGTLSCLVDTGDETLLLEDQRAVLRAGRPSAAAVAATRQADPYESTCALVERDDALVIPRLVDDTLRWYGVHDGHTAELAVGRGVRGVHTVRDRDREWLMAVQYLTGELWLIDPREHAIRAQLTIGDRGRRLTFSRDGLRAYVVTRSGAFQIDVPALIEKGNRP